MHGLIFAGFSNFITDQVLCMHRGDPACVFHATPIG